jgi:4-amino-4-deoxy-L-arabinose transferase-like glycosyltransferase
VGGVGDLICFYASTGLTFLTKGPVASLLLLLILAPFALLHRGQGARRTESWGLAWGIPLIVALALPWYLYAMLKTPGLLQYFVGDQLASRLGSSGMGHPHSWTYYIAVFPALGLPWILFAPKGWRALRHAASPLATFLGLWALVPPVVFSVPATKLPLYVLPAYPALALLAARCLIPEPEAGTPALRFTAWLFLFLGAALAVVGLGAVPLGRGDLAALPLESARVLFLPLGLICLVGGACALGWAREKPSHAGLALVLAVALLPLWAFTKGDLLPVHTVKIVGRAAALELQPGDALAAYRDLSSGLPFYAGRMPLLAGIRRETQFEDAETSERVISREEFRDLWSGRGRVLAVTRLRHADDLAGGRELARGGGYVLLANH